MYSPESFNKNNKPDVEAGIKILRAEQEPDEQSLTEREKNTDKMFDDFLQLKQGERVLFLIDNNPNNTDPKLIEMMKQRLEARNIEYDELVADEETTQRDIFKKAKKCDLIWASWSMEDTHKSVDFDDLTEFLKGGKENKGGKKVKKEKARRMAFCPGVTAEFLDNGGALTEDRKEMEERLGKMEERLKEAVGLRITTSYGTDLRMKLKRGERRWFKDAGIIKNGNWDNLPGGEIFTTPDEESIEGVLVLPVLQDEVTLDQGVDKLVHLTIKNGKIRAVDGGISAEKLRKYLKENSINEDDPESVLQISEIAFGANSKARTVANPEGGWDEKDNPVVEKEKRLGTIHLATGSSKHGEEGTEGHTESDVHLDFVIPRNGLTVETFDYERDYRSQNNGRKLINEGSWNFV